MRNTRTWLVVSGALALGAGAAAVGFTPDLGRSQQTVGPGVLASVSASVVPGDEQGASSTSAEGRDGIVVQSPTTADRPDPVSANSPGSPNSPASPNSPDSPNSPESPDSAD